MGVFLFMETYKEKLVKADPDEKLAEAEMELNNKEELLDSEMVFEKLKNRYEEK